MLTKQQIDALEAEHGEIAHVVGRDYGKGPAWEIVLRRPERKHYKVFRAMANHPEKKSDAQEYLTKQMVVYPPPDKFAALLEENLGLCESDGVSKAITALCRMESDDSGKE